MRETGVKDRILDTASRLFYDQGYNPTGINQIIDEAAIARASLYNHYESKTDLLLAYLDRTHQRWFEELDEFLRPFTDPREKLLAIFDFRIRRQQKLKYRGCHFNKITAEACEEPGVSERVVVHKERLRKYIHELVLKVNRGRILGNDSLTDAIFLLMEGGLAVGAMYRNSKDTKAAKQIVENLL